VAVVSFVAIAVGLVGTAMGALPHVTIANPLNGSVSNNKTPSFSGLAEEADGAVTLRIYKGATAEGTVIQEMKTALLLGGKWSLGPAKPLKDGTYTAQATQTNPASETGTSLPVTFTVDTAAPTVTLNPPGSPSDDTTPSFTGTASDITPVTIQIHTGATEEGTIVSTATATGTGGGWTSDDASPALATGQYTAVAIQESSLLGNPAGMSGPVTFTVALPQVVTPPQVTTQLAPPAPPAASFKWIPSAPQTGEAVTLVSTSTDASSPITAFSWDLAGDGVFTPGESTLATSFSTPGAHVVQLRVTDSNGLSSTVAEMIAVSSPAPTLMQPFPVVRIVGSYSSSGAKISLLTVLAPAWATVKVTCRGRGCSIKSQHLVATSPSKRKAGTVLITFHRFERSLRAGAVLDVWVSSKGQIGKFTRFRIRHGELPSRTDMCLNPAGTEPIVCPSA